MASKKSQKQLSLAEETPDKESEESGQTVGFDHSVAELESIVERLETENLPLEESLRLFEEGVKLARRSQATLDAAERRVEELLGMDDEGNPVVREIPFDDESDD